METHDDNQHSAAVEDYIKQIYKLQVIGESATTQAVARRMGLGKGTVSGMLKQLAHRGLVNLEPYRGVELTDEGKFLALRMVRRHRLIELFLVKVLGLGWDEVDVQAEQLEHAFSDKLIQRIDAILGHPAVDPHGAPIPDREGKVQQQDYRALSDFTAGERGVVRRVSDSQPQFLRYLEDLGLKLDAEVSVKELAPFGTVVIRTGDRDIHLAREAAERIFMAKRGAGD